MCGNYSVSIKKGFPSRLHIPLRAEAFRGRGQASSSLHSYGVSGQQDAGHKGVVTRCDDLSLCSLYAFPAGVTASSLHVLFSNLRIDVPFLKACQKEVPTAIHYL